MTNDQHLRQITRDTSLDEALSAYERFVEPPPGPVDRHAPPVIQTLPGVPRTLPPLRRQTLHIPHCC